MKLSKISNERGIGFNKLLVAIVAIGLLSNVFDEEISNLKSKTKTGVTNVSHDAQAFFKPTFLPQKD